MKIIVNIIVIGLLLLTCQSSTDTAEKIRYIKSLEYSRVLDLSIWENIYDNPEYENLKPFIIRSMGKCRFSRFLPFYEKLIKTQTTDSVENAIIFSLGQLKSPISNQILLSLDLKKYSLENQKLIIQTLAINPDLEGLKFIETYLDNPELKSLAFKALALFGRNKIYSTKARTMALDSLSIASPSEYVAYFLYYTSGTHQLRKIIEMASNADGYPLKLLMKSCEKIVKNKNNYIKNILDSDSTLKENFYIKCNSILSKENEHWATQVYTLNCFHSIRDSNLLPTINSLTYAKNPHVRIAANSALISYSQDMQTILLKNIHEEKSFFVKSEIIKILAKHNPKTAYPIIQQNLSKGNNYFKANLLEAMGIIKTRDSRRVLRGFLQVPNTLLVNKAFSILDQRNAIMINDAENMLQKSEESSVSMAIDWYSKSKYRIKPELLVKIFTSSSTQDQFDIQRSILNYFKIKKVKLNQEDASQLFNTSCSYQITDMLKTIYPEIELKSKADQKNILPPYLNTDSLNFSYSLNAQIETNKGVINLVLFPKAAPLTVGNFIHLAETGFYNGNCFHRVVADFVIQGGDPNGDGWGGPGYFIPSENNLKPFQRGSVGMATSGFDTGGSQFFICQSPQSHLTGNYTLFGQVVAGHEIVDLIEPGDIIKQISIEP